MAAIITIKLTPLQALVLWQIIDGAADAGACEDGLRPYEAKALEAVTDKLLSQHDKWKAAKP